jgi:hypothetical protein
MPPYLKTPAAARKLGTSYHRLIGLIRFGKIDPPAATRRATTSGPTRTWSAPARP